MNGLADTLDRMSVFECRDRSYRRGRRVVDQRADSQGTTRSSGNLYTVFLPDGKGDLHLRMMAGTSPSIPRTEAVNAAIDQVRGCCGVPRR